MSISSAVLDVFSWNIFSGTFSISSALKKKYSELFCFVSLLLVRELFHSNAFQHKIFLLQPVDFNRVMIGWFMVHYYQGTSENTVKSMKIKHRHSHNNIHRQVRYNKFPSFFTKSLDVNLLIFVQTIEARSLKNLWKNCLYSNTLLIINRTGQKKSSA